MIRIFSIILVLLLAVSMVAPMLVMSRSEIDAFRIWFEELGMESQALMYSALRLISYPYLGDLQNGLLVIHGVVGTALVVTIGEVLGSGVQLALFDTIVAPLFNIRGKPQLEFIASALRGMPVGYSALLQLTAAPILVTCWPPFMLGVIGDSELMINFALGTILGQFVNLEFKILVMSTPTAWASDFLKGAIIPAVRTVTSVLLAYWLWQEARAVADGAGNQPEAPLLDAAADIPTDVDAADEPEADLEEILAGAKTAPAGRRVKSAVTSAVKAAAETVRRTGRSAKARVLRFHEAAPAMEDTLKSWTPPQLRAKHADSERDNSEEPVTRRTRRSTVTGTPKRSASAARKERAENRTGLSVATRSRGRSKMSVPGPTEEGSMITSGSMGVSRKSTGPKRGTVEHRLETTLTDSVYNTPGRETRSRRLSQLPTTTAD